MFCKWAFVKNEIFTFGFINRSGYYGYPVIAVAFAWLHWRFKIEIGVRRIPPTADVAEVKRGKWIADDDGIVICSECGEEHDWDDFRPPYCDMCGAKMGGDEK